MPPPLRRIPLLPLAGLGIVLVAGIAAILLSRSVAHANAWVDQTVRLQVDGIRLGERLARQESAFRGYLLRGDPALRMDYARATEQVFETFAEIDGLTTRNTPEQARIDAIGRLVRRRIGYMEAYMHARDRLGRLPPPQPLEQVYGRPLGLRIRALIGDNTAAAQRLLNRRQLRTQRLTDALSIALASAVLLVVMVALITVGDARRRYLAMTDAHRDARTAARAAHAEVQAREEAETQLRQIQRMESLGQLTGGIAHDFNNMLAVVIGSLDMARRRSGEPNRVQSHIENALDGAERAAALVARLLAFSRRQPLAPATIDPAAMVATMADLLARTLGEQIEVATQLVGEVWAIHADPGQLENAILNLALNARDAMEGGGELFIIAENRTLDHAFVRAHPDVAPGDYVCLSVCDRGPGMTADVQARAFDPFFTTKSVGKGTGLGLSQVFGFAKQSGGHVGIESREGGGLVVRLFLPRAEISAERPRARPGRPNADTRARRAHSGGGR